MYRLILNLIVTIFFICSCHSDHRTHDDHDHDDHQHEQHEHDHTNHDDHQNTQDHEEEGNHQHDGHEHESDQTHTHGAQHEDDSEATEHESALGEIQQHAVQEVAPKPFHDILHVSGRIMPSQKGQSMLAARHAGLVVFDNYRLIEGQRVKKGQKLFLISAKGLTHNNLETKYIEVKNEFEKARQDYERAQKLLDNQIISKSEYQERKVKYENIKNRFNNIKKNYVKGGQPVYASTDGFISNLYVKEGEYVEIGSPLAAIVEDKRLVIKAEVPQDLISELPYVTSASFSPAYNEAVYFTDSLNGQLLSVGRSTSESVYTPVFFEIDYQPQLIPGAYADIFLHAHGVENAIVIPESAILEELNRYYIYKWAGHEFTKQYIRIAGRNGVHARVAEGLKPHDRIATRDVYRIRLSQMSGAMPEHAHNHAH